MYSHTREEIVNYLYELMDHYYYWSETAFGLGNDAIKRMDVFFDLICILTEES